MGDSPEAIPARLARGETADVVILDAGAAATQLGRTPSVTTTTTCRQKYIKHHGPATPPASQLLSRILPVRVAGCPEKTLSAIVF
jgi:hypothetical protein